MSRISTNEQPDPAKLFTNRRLSAGTHDMSLLPRGRYLTVTKPLSTGTPHMAIYLKEEQNDARVRYTLAIDPQVPEPDLYFGALVKYSAVPVHPGWKSCLFSRAAKKKKIEGLTAHRIRGIKIHLNDESLAQDIMRDLKKGRLRKDWRAPLFPAKFDSSAMHI